jgi:hypothetical protein
MIATVAEIKNILGINAGDTSKDARIAFLMNIVEAELHDICKNHFIRDIDIDNNKYIGANTLSFTASTNKINDSASNLTTFIVGNTIKVRGSLENDGIYYISGIDAGGAYITLDSTYGQVTDEVAGEYIGIYKLWYSKALKFPFSSMINYRLSEDNNKINKGIQTEKIDDYSVSFGISKVYYGYPSSIINMLTPYRKYY